MRISGFAAILLSLLCSLPIRTPAGEAWTNYGHENEITDLAARGDYVWCATTNGLVRWDKRDMSSRKYTMKDGLPHSVINSIDIAPDGAVWCATDGGLARFDGTSWMVFKQADGLEYTGIATVATGPDNAVWAGTYFYSSFIGKGGGLSRYTGDTWKSFASQQISPITHYGPMRAITVSPDGTVWLGTENGVCCYRGETFEVSYADYYINTILAAQNGTIWAAGWKNIFMHAGINWNTIPLPSGFTSVYSLAAQPDGILWAGMADGLLRYDGSTWKHYTAADGLPDNSISGLTVDDSGVLWIGTPNGLSRFDGVSFQTWRTEEELISKSIFSLGFESNGTVWAGTPSGIMRFDGANWRSFTMKDGLPHNNITSIAVTSNGDVWAGTPKGVARYFGSGWKTYTTADGLPDSAVYSMAAGKDNSLWLSTAKGVTRFDGQTWKTYTREDSCTAYPGAIAVSRNGFVSVSGYGTLSRFNGKSWKNHPLYNSPADGWLVGIEGGPDSTVFLATGKNVGSVHNPAYYTSVYCLGDSMRQYSGVGGLPRAFATGNAGEVWLGMDYDFTGYHDYGEGGVVRREGTQTTRFNETDGLSYRIVNTIAIAPDGAVWFGTGKGLSRYGLPMTIGVESGPALPKEFAVVSNHPNPFNPSTTISFTLPHSARAELAVYSITGQKIRALLSGPMTAGTHSAVWDGRDDAGKMVSSGVYLTQLRSGKQVSSGKMLLMK